MNCANHADASAVAYCRTCGKALCANCTRPVKGVIYCENCLADRMAGVQPQQTVYQPAPGFRIENSPATNWFRSKPRFSGRAGCHFSVRRRSSLLRAIRQGTRAPGDSRHAVAGQTVSDSDGLHALARDLAWHFSTSTRLSTRCARPKPFKWDSPHRIRLVWHGRSARANESTRPKIPTGAIVSDRPRRSVSAAHGGLSNLVSTASGRLF